MSYLIVKWLHILSSTVLFGTGIGSAFYMFFATLRRDPRVVASVVGLVVWADAIFTTSTIVFQPLSGWTMLHLAGIPLSTRWVQWSIGLYVLATACWLPVVWLQIKLRDIARQAVAAGTPLPRRYWRLFGVWVALGVPALIAFLVIFWLMVAKPA